jgi:hypothetical protein
MFQRVGNIPAMMPASNASALDLPGLSCAESSVEHERARRESGAAALPHRRSVPRRLPTRSSWFHWWRADRWRGNFLRQPCQRPARTSRLRDSVPSGASPFDSPVDSVTRCEQGVCRLGAWRKHFPMLRRLAELRDHECLALRVAGCRLTRQPKSGCADHARFPSAL